MTKIVEVLENYAHVVNACLTLTLSLSLTLSLFPRVVWSAHREKRKI